jgi:hypothetical protein
MKTIPVSIVTKQIQPPINLEPSFAEVIRDILLAKTGPGKA